MGQGQSGELPGGEGGDDTPTMKAFVMESPGKFTDMKQTTVYVPNPDKGEIRVRVMCTGLNPVDYKRCQFADADFPCILGADVAGVVDAVGEGVTEFQVGDKVYYHANVRKQYGAFAEYSLTTAVTTAPMPEGLSFVEAAAIPCSGWAAYIALYYKLKVLQHQSILITGAGGGVGSYAVQLAKLSGLRVFAICSHYKRDFVKEMGADHVFSSEDSEESTLQNILQVMNGSRVDHVLDTVGAQSAIAALQYVKLHGSICCVAAPIICTDLFDKGLSLHYLNIGGLHQSSQHETKQLLATVGRDMGLHFSSRQLRTPILEDCTFDQIPAALQTLQEGRVKGKLVAHVTSKEEQLAAMTPPPPPPPVEPQPPVAAAGSPQAPPAEVAAISSFTEQAEPAVAAAVPPPPPMPSAEEADPKPRGWFSW